MTEWEKFQNALEDAMYRYGQGIIELILSKDGTDLLKDLDEYMSTLNGFIVDQGKGILGITSIKVQTARGNLIIIKQP
jgi:hypothetical protein